MIELCEQFKQGITNEVIRNAMRRLKLATIIDIVNSTLCCLSVGWLVGWLVLDGQSPGVVWVPGWTGPQDGLGPGINWIPVGAGSWDGLGPGVDCVLGQTGYWGGWGPLGGLDPGMDWVL